MLNNIGVGKKQQLDITRFSLKNIVNQEEQIIKGKILDKVVVFIAIASLIILLGLRLYAIYDTVPIRTWDDTQYREAALKTATPDISISGALDDIIFPNGKLFLGSRSIGYHSWLVLGLKLSLSGDPEQVFQLVNLSLLIIQGISLFLLGKWATKNNLFATSLTFIYLSSPIVFGMNRWVMTENFVLTALLIFSLISIWLLTRKSANTIRKDLAYGIISAWIMGIFGSLREYAVPSYLVILIGTGLALYWQGRRDALRGFVVVSLLFIVTMLAGWIHLVQLMAFRTTQTEYFHPLSKWIYHSIIYGIGPALTILLGIGILVLIQQLIFLIKQQRNLENFHLSVLTKKLNGLHILWIANLLLVPFYSLAILSSDNRPARAVIPLMLSLISASVLSIKVISLPKNLLNHSVTKLFFLGLIALSWVILYQQLFIAFEGGKTYAHTAHGLEYYNHPLHLRKLHHPNELHVQ